MANAQGSLKVKANGKTYTLWVGLSVLADLQDQHGLDALAQLEPPEGATDGWMPKLSILTDLFLGALQRNHADVADRWLVDDIIAQNSEAFNKLMGASNPDVPKGKPLGNAKRPRPGA